MAALALTPFLLSEAIYRWLLAAQLAFYVAAGCGLLAPGNHKALRVLRLSTMFASMNVALLFGFWRWIFGLQRGTWQRTARGAEGVAP